MFKNTKYQLKRILAKKFTLPPDQQKKLRRLDKIFIHNGYTTKKKFEKFLKMNIVEYEGNRIQVSLQKSIRRWMEPEKITVNGHSLRYIGPLTVALHKPEGLQSELLYLPPTTHLERVELENNGIDLEKDRTIYTDVLPYEFSFRKPGFHHLNELETDYCGLMVISQKKTLVKSVLDVKRPLIRKYEITIDGRWTGLEEEAMTFYRGAKSVALYGAPILEPKTDNKAVLTLRDVKRDDAIADMLISLKQIPVTINRIQFGGIQTYDESMDGFVELNEKQPWVDLSAEQENQFLSGHHKRTRGTEYDQRQRGSYSEEVIS